MFILLGPKRRFLAGFVKSPNLWRWLAHGVAKWYHLSRCGFLILNPSPPHLVLPNLSPLVSVT